MKRKGNEDTKENSRPARSQTKCPGCGYWDSLGIELCPKCGMDIEVKGRLLIEKQKKIKELEMRLESVEEKHFDSLDKRKIGKRNKIFKRAVIGLGTLVFFIIIIKMFFVVFNPTKSCETIFNQGLAIMESRRNFENAADNFNLISA